jgi:hypothetical protein
MRLTSTKTTTKDNLKSYLWFSSSGEQHGEQHYSAEDPQAELMHWHYRLGHLPFPRLKLLRRWGGFQNDWWKWFLLIVLAVYSEQWQGIHGIQKRQVVSVNQMGKTKVGLVAQLMGVWLIDTVPPPCCGKFLASLVHVSHDESIVKVDSCCKKKPLNFLLPTTG